MGAVPIVAAVCALSRATPRPRRAFFVRKETKDHGTERRVEGYLPDGGEVLLFEDVTTTGGSAMIAVEAARAAGCRVGDALHRGGPAGGRGSQSRPRRHPPRPALHPRRLHALESGPRLTGSAAAISRTTNIDTSGLRRCIGTLEAAFVHLRQEGRDGPMRDIFRAACVKEFELVLEVGAALLRRRLKDFFASGREVDRLIFRDSFRHAANHALVTNEACERWLRYRDIRNASAPRLWRAFRRDGAGAHTGIRGRRAGAGRRHRGRRRRLRRRRIPGSPGSRIWVLSLPDDENGPKFSSNSEENRCVHLGATVLAGPDLGQWEAP